MSLPIFDQISLGAQYAFSSFLPVFFIISIIGIIWLVSAGWTAALAFVLMSGAFAMVGWAGYSTYGTIGISVVFVAYILTVTLFALIRR